MAYGDRWDKRRDGKGRKLQKLWAKGLLKDKTQKGSKSMCMSARLFLGKRMEEGIGRGFDIKNLMGRLC